MTIPLFWGQRKGEKFLTDVVSVSETLSKQVVLSLKDTFSVIDVSQVNFTKMLGETIDVAKKLFVPVFFLSDVVTSSEERMLGFRFVPRDGWSETIQHQLYPLLWGESGMSCVSVSWEETMPYEVRLDNEKVDLSNSYIFLSIGAWKVGWTGS